MQIGAECSPLGIGLPDIEGVEIYDRIARRWPDLRAALERRRVAAVE